MALRGGSDVGRQDSQGYGRWLPEGGPEFHTLGKQGATSPVRTMNGLRCCLNLSCAQGVRRKAVSIEWLNTEAPKLIHAMLVGLVEKKTRTALIRLIEPAKAKVPEAAALSEHQLAALPKARLQEFAQQAEVPDARIQEALSNDQFFADADGNGHRDQKDMHTLEEITDIHRNLDVNTAELLALRLYTGPMFEFYNNVLRYRQRFCRLAPR